MKKVLSLCLVLCLAITLLLGAVPANAATGIKTGAWLGAWPSTRTMDNFDSMVGRKTEYFHTFINTTHNMGNTRSFMDAIYTRGATPIITMELKSNGGSYTTADVNNGLLDAYFKQWALDLKSWQGGATQIWRFMHECNGNWYSWCIGDSTVNTNASYIAAFQRVVNIFRSNGCTNVKWMYNINCDNAGVGASYMGAYPGDAYVDYISIDGYNWGTTQTWSTWKPFRSVFDTAYAAITAGSTRPVFIGEWASTEVGGSKSAWITDAFNQLKANCYPRMQGGGVIWFNERKETDWRVESTSASQTAYKNALVGF